MKKQISLLMVALLCVAMFVACGNGAKVNETADKQQQNTAEDTQGMEEKESEVTEEEKIEQAYDSKWILGAKLNNLDKEKTDVTELISGNKVTMVNFWGTFCGPCISEMPDIEKLYQKNKDKGLGIAAITLDVAENDDEGYQEAKDIVDETGVSLH